MDRRDARRLIDHHPTHIAALLQRREAPGLRVVLLGLCSCNDLPPSSHKVPVYHYIYHYLAQWYLLIFVNKNKNNNTVVIIIIRNLVSLLLLLLFWVQ